MSQPFGLASKGGLYSSLNQLEMLQQPGIASTLRNFEVDADGGYRRINGYSLFGGGTRPENDVVVQGVYPYGLGVVVVSGTSVYYGEDGTNWIQVNRNTGHVGVTEANLGAQAELDRPNQGQAQFVLMRAPTGHTSNEYGSLTIATEGGDKLAHFHIDGTGPSRLFIYEEIATPAAGQYIEEHDKHLCVVDPVNAPSTVYYSKTNDDRDFTGTGSGSVAISDRITGIKSFRDELYIFCENTIHKLININDTASLAVVQVTNNVGCLSGYSIQEIGGDLLFLSPDGLRTVAATARIGDVELGSVSRPIQNIIENIAKNIDKYRISSAVLRYKSQYRLFYNIPTGAEATADNSAKGIIATLTRDGFQFSETLGIKSTCIASGFDEVGIERTYHGDSNGYVYTHDVGNSFNPAGIEEEIDAAYQTPSLDFGDAGTRKTMRYIRLSVSPEGEIRPTLRVRYDYEDPKVAQPLDYVFDEIPLPSVLGTGIFASSVFGAPSDPLVRKPIQGSGNTVSFIIRSNDTKSPYKVNGMYVDYSPSGRR